MQGHQSLAPRKSLKLHLLTGPIRSLFMSGMVKRGVCEEKLKRKPIISSFPHRDFVYLLLTTPPEPSTWLTPNAILLNE